MDFNVCILDSSTHTQCFAEIADSIEWALKELGHDVERRTTAWPGRTNIIFGARPEHVSQRFPVGTVFYNGEQVGPHSMFNVLAPLYLKYSVWDYSETNAKRYGLAGLGAPQVVRPGFAPVLDGRIPEKSKRIDVVFFGSMNDRRKKILTDLLSRGLIVTEVPFGVYGAERDAVLAAAKLCVNIHYYESSIFEAVRCSYLAQNGLPVLSEESAGDEGATWCIAGVPYDKLADSVVRLVNDQAELDRLAICQQAAARQVPLLSDMRSALEHLVLKGQTKRITRAVFGDRVYHVPGSESDGEQEATGLTGVVVQGRGERDTSDGAGGERDAVMAQATGDKASDGAGLGTDAVVMVQDDAEARSGVVEQGMNTSPGVVEQAAKARDLTMSDGDAGSTGSLKSDGVQAITVQLKIPELTLNMIVKNEAAIIERCLSSVKPYLAGWCIVDTGSTDGTQDIIRRFMEGVPGQLHECSWKEYDGSRTEAIELASKFAQGRGWLLLIDADEIFQLDGEELLLPDGYGCYDGWISRCLGCVRWGRPLFARAGLPWFYAMPRHEGLYCHVHAPTAPRPVDNARVISLPDGARARNPGRYLRDAQVLESWAVQHPGNSRAQYYIAQSYRDAATSVQPIDRNAMQKAIMHYLTRANMAGYEAETFSAMYQAAQCMVSCGYPWERVQQQLMKAWNFRPSRVEPIYNIARYYRESRQFALAEIFARKAAMTPMKEDIFPDFDRSVYEWRSKEELAVALTYLSGHAEARDLNLEIIDRVPPHERERIQANLDMCLREAPLLPQK